MAPMWKMQAGTHCRWARVRPGGWWYNMPQRVAMHRATRGNWTSGPITVCCRRHVGGRQASWPSPHRSGPPRDSGRQADARLLLACVRHARGSDTWVNAAYATGGRGTGCRSRPPRRAAPPAGKGRWIMGKLDGKVAVVTGGTSGVGLAAAQRFVEDGAYVFITGRRQEELDAAVRQIGRNVQAIRGDVSQLADLEHIMTTVKEQKGRIDVLFANAGIAEAAPLAEITEDFFDRHFAINVKGALFAVQKALPLLRD